MPLTVSAPTQQPSSFGVWGSSPISFSMRSANAGWGSLKRVGSVGSSWTVSRPKIGTSATLCPVPDTMSCAFEDLLRRTHGISTSLRRRTSVASPTSASPPREDGDGGELSLPTPSKHHGSSSSGASAGLASASLSPSGSVVVGFDIGAQQGGSSAAAGGSSTGMPVVPGLTFAGRQSGNTRPLKARGLLSKALDVPPPVMEFMSRVPSFSMDVDPLMQFSWFPDVDPRPLKEAQARHPVFSSELVTTAFMIASRCYRGKVRKNGDTVLHHCLETALLVADLGLDMETVAAALLHEALRPGDDFMSQLEEFMPRSVVERVQRVQTITEVSQWYRRQDNGTTATSAEHRSSDDGMCRMLIAMEDVCAVLIKLADRVHTMRSVEALPRDHQVSLARETLDVYSVVANRLGVWYLKAELEDSAFAVLNPEEFECLREQVRERHDTVALAETINTIRAQLDDQGIKYEDLSGRQKNLYGIWTKMQRDGKTLDEVLDVVALRVVVSKKHDCYEALRRVRDVYRTVPGRTKDYIRGGRKANGYQSLHETIIGAGGRPVEVQIRTHKMHYIAEYGFAAHWKYKEELYSDDKWLDKQVHYKKWLTHYKLGVHDKKVRPNGSPPTDSSLKGLGFQYVDGVKPEELDKVDEFLRHERFRLEPPPPLATHVHVQVHDQVQVCTLPAGLMVAELSRQLGVGGGCDGPLAGQVLLLNGRRPADDAVLRSGDLVQVVPESPALLSRPVRKPRRSASTTTSSATYAGGPHSSSFSQPRWPLSNPATATAAATVSGSTATVPSSTAVATDTPTVSPVPFSWTLMSEEEEGKAVADRSRSSCEPGSGSGVRSSGSCCCRHHPGELDGLDLFLPGCGAPVELDLVRCAA